MNLTHLNVALVLVTVAGVAVAATGGKMTGITVFMVIDLL